MQNKFIYEISKLSIHLFIGGVVFCLIIGSFRLLPEKQNIDRHVVTCFYFLDSRDRQAVSLF